MVSNKIVESNKNRVHLLNLGEGEWTSIQPMGTGALSAFKFSSPFANTLIHIVYVDCLMREKLVVIASLRHSIVQEIQVFSQN